MPSFDIFQIRRFKNVPVAKRSPMDKWINSKARMCQALCEGHAGNLISAKGWMKMTTIEFLKKGKRITAQEFRMNMLKILKSRQAYFVTDRGKPVKAIISHGVLLELLEIFEELNDKTLIQAVTQGRKEYREGGQGIPVNRLFNKIKKFRS